MTESAEVALIAGVGEGLGSAIARRFAGGGFVTALVARSAERLSRIVDEIEHAGGRGVAHVADLRDESAVTRLFQEVETELGPISLAVFNAAGYYRASILDTRADMFENLWRASCYAGFLVGREAARHMTPRGHGSVIFTGATASLRGGSQFAAFAAAKGGLRQLAQAMARELGPKGIHVASVIIDGAIDSHERIGQPPDEAALRPDHIAETYWQLHHQPRDAWTFEVDLRPWVEKF